MTETAVTPIAQPAQPIPYGTGSSPRVGPPVIVPLIGGASVAIAVLTIALSTWSATRAYYTKPRFSRAAQIATWTPPAYAVYSTRRVTLDEGNALLDGIAKVVLLSSAQRNLLSKVLVEAEDHVSVDLGPDPTPDKIAAAVVKSGKLFGEDGSFIEFAQVRVEVSTKRARIMGEPGDRPLIEQGSSGSTTSAGGGSQVWTFVPPPPPPLPPVTPPPPPPTLREQLNDLAPRLPHYADALISCALAVLLLVAGVGLLNYRRRGRTLHLVWAWIKLPAALAAAAGYFWLTMHGQLNLSPGLTPWTQFVLNYPAFVTSLLAALYAAAVLVLLCLPPVRRYFLDPQIPARSE